MEVALPDVRHAVEEADRAGPHGVGHDRRQLPPHGVELVEQRQRTSEHTASARDARRRDEDEAPHPLRLARRDLGRDQPAERVPEHVHAAEPCGVEKATEPRSELAGAQPSEPRQLDEAEAAALGQPRGDFRPPAPRTREPVHDHQVRP